MFSFRQKGDFTKTLNFLKKNSKTQSYYEILNKYGKKGVIALSSATPVDTGTTADSWFYKIVKGNDSITLEFHNSNISDGANIAVLIQYGHATRNGGWVDSVDYINPALKPIFDNIYDEIRREVDGV